MATIDGDFYDYNGVLFCHGQIKNTGSSVCSYVVMTIDGSYQYRANIKDKTNFPGIFNVNTYYHAINNSPKTLSSGTHTVYLDFYTSSGSLIDGGYLYSGSNRLDYKMHNTLTSPSLTYDAENRTITVTNKGTGRYYLEIRRQNRNLVKTDYTETEKDYFYTTLMRGTEGGKYYEGVPHTSFIEQGYKDDDGNLYEPIPMARYQWRSSIPTVVLFDSQAGFSDSEKATYYSWACEALDDLASVTGKKFTVRGQETRSGNIDFSTCVDNDYSDYYLNNDNNYQMMVRFGKQTTMHLAGTSGGSPIPGGQGRWGNYLSYDPYWGVATSHAAIAVDASQENETIKHVIYEEIMQSLGMGNDSHSQETSLHWDPHWSNPESYAGIDKTILELVCSTDICGWSGFDFLNKWDTPCLLFKDYTGSDLVFDVSELKDNESYSAWAWVVQKGSGGGIVGGSNVNGATVTIGGTAAVADGWDDDPYSMRAQISFNTNPSYPYPGTFSWTYPKIKDGSFNLTATEWNSLQDHIEAMLLHKLGETKGYSPTIVSKSGIFYASKYNEAGNAIRLISGYGTYIPTVYAGQEITADSSSNVPANNMMNKIVEELNAIPKN